MILYIAVISFGVPILSGLAVLFLSNYLDERLVKNKALQGDVNTLQ